MITKYIIHLSRGDCRCFSDRDLAVNIRFVIAQHLVIQSVEAVA